MSLRLTWKSQCMISLSSNRRIVHLHPPRRSFLLLLRIILEAGGAEKVDAQEPGVLIKVAVPPLTALEVGAVCERPACGGALEVFLMRIAAEELLLVTLPPPLLLLSRLTHSSNFRSFVIQNPSSHFLQFPNQLLPTTSTSTDEAG